MQNAHQKGKFNAILHKISNLISLEKKQTREDFATIVENASF